MIVTVEEMKNYLRVDFDDDDMLIEDLIRAAEKLCMDTLRVEDSNVLEVLVNGKIAVMYTVAYWYEHREEADQHELMLTLRALLSGDRKEEF